MATDPYRNFRYLLELGSITAAQFSEVGTFGATTEVIEYREGGEPPYSRKLPGQTKYTNIVLKSGVTADKKLFDWYVKITQGKIERIDGSVVLLDTEGGEAVRWNFFGAWPTKYSSPELTAKGNDCAIEVMELAIERIERA